MERRGCVTLSDIGRQGFVRRSVITPDKPLPIIKRMVWEAYQLVALNGKAAGVDGQSLENLRGILETTSTSPGIALCREATSRQR